MFYERYLLIHKEFVLQLHAVARWFELVCIDFSGLLLQYISAGRWMLTALVPSSTLSPCETSHSGGRANSV